MIHLTVKITNISSLHRAGDAIVWDRFETRSIARSEHRFSI